MDEEERADKGEEEGEEEDEFKFEFKGRPTPVLLFLLPVFLAPASLRSGYNSGTARSWERKGRKETFW